MRPYRAWDKKRKKMYEVNSIDFQKKIISVFEPKDIRSYCTGNIELPFKSIILMQSIGRKDKNKQEIYKGDKVRIMTHWERGDESKNKYRIEIVTENCSCGLNTNGMVSIQKEGQEEYVPQLEIIGNIHDKEEVR